VIHNHSHSLPPIIEEEKGAAKKLKKQEVRLADYTNKEQKQKMEKQFFENALKQKRYVSP